MRVLACVTFPHVMQQIVMFEEGEPLIDGEPGDLKFVITTLPHKRFERRGNDLWHNATISLEDALIGFSREVGSTLAAENAFNLSSLTQARLGSGGEGAGGKGIRPSRPAHKF